MSFSSLFDGQSWGFDGMDRRAVSVTVDKEPNFCGGWKPNKKSLLNVFKKILPYQFFVDVIVRQTSISLTEQKMQAFTEG